MKYLDDSYDIPPTYGTDQYTGNQVIIEEGRHVDGRKLEFTIKNQPFTPFNDTNGNPVGLYYNFRFKGQYTETWTCFPFDGTITTRTWSGWFNPETPEYPASNSTYTTIILYLTFIGVQAPNNTPVDFQVQTLMGRIQSQNSGMMAGSFYDFIGEISDWSSPQTLTIGQTTQTTTEPAPSSSLSPATAMPTTPVLSSPTQFTSDTQQNASIFVLPAFSTLELALLGAVGALAALLVVAVVYIGRKSVKQKS